jgi:glutaredoxin
MDRPRQHLFARRSGDARRLRALALCIAAGSLAMPAAALFKVVAPDGSVTYTDRPPAAAGARVTPIGRSAAPAQSSATLPTELRQPVQRHPVTLYTAADCPPCDSGRTLLQRRGVPYAEKIVADAQDAAALEQLIGARTVPAITIGAQPLRGFSQDEWTSYLDAAGYPRESRLPPTWQAPPPTPLVARRPDPAAEPRASAPPAAPEAPPLVTPGAIRF